MRLALSFICVFLLAPGANAVAQGANDTIRLGITEEHGQSYPMIFLPEYRYVGTFMDQETRQRHNRLRNDIYTVYPYALTAATILKQVNDSLDRLDGRRDRKRYLKTVDKKLDEVFKKPLKNLTVDQGHVLIKLIDRQTGQDCYSIIKELKGGFSAVVWQGVGVLFNNNLRKDYDPTGADKEMEGIVAELEASSSYRWQLYQQDALLKKISKK